jgi:predicted RNase H-like HicB family nuclease
MREMTALVEWDPATKLYVGSVPGVHGARTIASSLDELIEKLTEVTELCFEELGDEADVMLEFVGVQRRARSKSRKRFSALGAQAPLKQTST